MRAEQVPRESPTALPLAQITRITVRRSTRKNSFSGLRGLATNRIWPLSSPLGKAAAARRAEIFSSSLRDDASIHVLPTSLFKVKYIALSANFRALSVLRLPTTHSVPLMIL